MQIDINEIREISKNAKERKLLIENEKKNKEQAERQEWLFNYLERQIYSWAEEGYYFCIINIICPLCDDDLQRHFYHLQQDFPLVKEKLEKLGFIIKTDMYDKSPWSEEYSITIFWDKDATF